MQRSSQIVHAGGDNIEKAWAHLGCTE